MISPELARERAISFLTRQGLDRDFVENASIKLEDAQNIVNIILAQNPRQILEIGTFVGVSSAVLGLCVPSARIICIDPGLPVVAQNLLCLRQFEVSDRRTTLDFVSQLVAGLGLSERFSLHRGFFSCCFPVEADRTKLVDGKIEITAEIIGERVCQEFGPFDMAFLDADHRTEAVYSDLNVLYPHIKLGGSIVLHDAGEDFWGQQVKAAVGKFLGERTELTFEARGDIGIIYKKIA